MGAGKEMWFAEMERLTGEYIDAGMDPEDAYNKASDNAHRALGDRLADMADRAKKRERGE